MLPHQKNTSYRPDIDGLRAVAVLAVVIFHFNKSWLPGGFVGVDVFFVISGFLITGILSAKIENGSFSLLDFYASRARRILPAALFCILVTLVAGSVLLLPDDAKALHASALAASVSAANFYYWLYLDTGYFSASSETIPLLHLWSLAVEEQFYIFWPLVLLLLTKCLSFHSRAVLVLAICVASFWVGQAYLAADPSFAYYLLPSRAGELLVGALGYMASRRMPILNRVTANGISLIGAALLVYALIFTHEANGFPGIAAIAPTVGTALLIYANTRSATLAGRALSLRPLVMVGLVSFSLYLWHWPVLALYRYGYGVPTTTGYLACALIMVVMTLLSYWLVERPFRIKTKLGSWPVLFRAAIVTFLIGGVSLWAYMLPAEKPFLKPSGYMAKLAQVDSATQPAYMYPYNCQMASMVPQWFRDKKCVLGPKDQAPRVLIWGDSNAAHYVGFFKRIAEHNGTAIRNLSHSSCVPLLKTSALYTPISVRESCATFNDAIEQDLHNYDTVIIGAGWTGYNGPHYRENIAASIEAVSNKAKHVIVALIAPMFMQYDRQCNMKALTYRNLNCNYPRARTGGPEEEMNTFLRGVVAKLPNVALFSVDDLLCDEQSCRPFVDHFPAYFDYAHLNMLGSEKLGDRAIAQNKIPDLYLTTGE